MKYPIYLFPLLILVISCQNQGKRYTQHSSEIEGVKALIQDYNIKDWDQWLSHYDDTAKIYYNSIESMPFKDGPVYHQQNDLNLASRGFLDDRNTYEMVVDDDGKTWVNFWGVWKCTLAADGKEITVPVHVTYRFVEGNITEEYGYWDNSPILMGLQEVESRQKMAESN